MKLNSTHHHPKTLIFRGRPIDRDISGVPRNPRFHQPIHLLDFCRNRWTYTLFRQRLGIKRNGANHRHARHFDSGRTVVGKDRIRLK